MGYCVRCPYKARIDEKEEGGAMKKRKTGVRSPTRFAGTGAKLGLDLKVGCRQLYEVSVVP